MSDAKTPFASSFEKAHATVELPEVYRRFIIDGNYVEYRTSFIKGLINRGPTYVEVKLDDKETLNVRDMYDERDIEHKDIQYQPIATIRYTHEFLAIDISDDKYPVFIWTHDDGSFHLQFDSFDDFLSQLRTKPQMNEEKAIARKQWSDIKKQCKPALTRARKYYAKDDLERAQAAINKGLVGLSPIEYTGHETDYKAIELMAELFNLRGLVDLKCERYDDAVRSFTSSCECRLCTAAFVHAIVALSIVEDVPAAYAIGLSSRALADFRPGGRIDPIPYLDSFSVEQRNKANQVLSRHSGPDEEMKFANQIIAWLTTE